VIKMNTGNSKTLVGVMLLTGSMNKPVGPAAYLTPHRCTWRTSPRPLPASG
jgi:hypothetical protein